MSKDEKEAAAPEAPKKSSKNLIIIVLAVVLLAGGGGGAYLTLSGSKAEAAPKPGVVKSLDAITINLETGHYLKVAFALQATADAAAEPDGAEALDLAIDTYTGMKVADLSTEKGREAAKKDLLTKIKKAYNGDVMDIYFTQFVIQ